MPEFTSDAPGLDRRHLLVGSAIAVPAIMLTTAVPAHATSANSTLTVDIAAASITAGSSSGVTATVLNSQGLPWAGQSVSLSVAGSTGATLASTSGVTNSAGQVTTTLNVDSFTANNATLTVTATSGPLTATDTATVSGGVTLDLVATAATSGSPAGGINAGSANTVAATLKNASNVGISGRTITFGVTGITGTYSSVTATTNSSGVATVTLTPNTWTVPGTTATLTASTTAGTATVITTIAPLVLGANALASGDNTTYALADGTTTSRAALTQPLRVFPATIARVVSGGWYSGSPGLFTLFLLDDGTVWSVGKNNSGQLGLGHSSDISTPTRIPGLADIAEIAAGDDNAMARTHGGAVLSWGNGSSGSNGDGTTTTRTSPVQVSGLTSGVTQIAAHAQGGYALTASRTVAAWGANNVGQLGDGSTTNRSTPVTVMNLTNVDAITASAGAGYALVSNGVRAWGLNDVGQLGDGSTTNRSAPVTVPLAGQIKQIAAGYGHCYSVTTTGSVMAWGDGYWGQLGNGGLSNSSSPVAVSGLGSGVQEIGAYGWNGFAKLSDGTLRVWGYNGEGQIGNGTTNGRSTASASPLAVSVPFGRTVKDFNLRSSTANSTFFVTEA